MQDLPLAHDVNFGVKADDLRLLLEYSKEVGAEEALAVKVADLTFKEAKRRKCEVPNCASYLTNLHCPPMTPDAKRMASCVPDSYEHAILTVMYSDRGEVTFGPHYRAGAKWSVRTDMLVEKVESKALALGYYKAMGFTCGPCALCGMWNEKWIMQVLEGKNARKCSVLDGKTCILHRRSRPAAEACGINVIDFIREMGLAPRHLIFPEVSEQAQPRCPWYGFILIG